MAPQTPSTKSTNKGLRRHSQAMLKVDLVEAVRLSEDPRDEQQVAERWRDFLSHAQRELLAPANARVVHREGDGLLVAAPRAVDGVLLAMGLHRLLPRFNAGLPHNTHFHLRVGLHEGQVLYDANDLYGREVNLAARLKDLASPGQTVCSARVREQIIEGVDAETEDLGECHLKHLRKPVRAYRVFEARQRSAGAALAGAPAHDAALPLPPQAELRIGLAVVPFETRADTRAGEVAGEMLADTLIAALSKGSHLRLISRLSTRALAGRSFDARSACELLGADYVLTGKVFVDQRRLLVSAELAQASGEVVWTDTLRCSSSELLAGDSELVLRTAHAISAALLQQQLREVRCQPLPNLSSCSLLLGGITLMHRFSRSDFLRAQACLQALTERAPRHAEPYAWLARWHLFNAVQGWADNPRQEWQKALGLCQRARDLDPGSALALAVEGSVRVRLDRALDDAMHLYRQALDYNPNEPLAELLLGTAHNFKGEGADAVEHAERALALTPLDPMRFFYDVHASAAHLTAGNLGRAVELGQRSLQANRLHVSTLRTLAIAQSLAGQTEAARGTVRLLLQYEPQLTAASFLALSPGGSFEHGRRFAQALVEAGLPPGV